MISHKKTKSCYLTTSNVLIATVVGCLSYVAVYYVVHVLKSSNYSNATFLFIYERWFNRGSIPHLEGMGFLIGAALLIIRIPLLFKESKKINEYEDVIDNLGDGQPDKILRNDTKWLIDQHIAAYITRAKTSADGAEFDSAMQQFGDYEQRRVDASHVAVRYLIWVIPTLGFLGTVLGISNAVAGFSEIVTKSTASMADLKGNLVEICYQLGVAFDTTFVALIYSAILAFFMSFIDRWEMRLLNDIDALCLTKLRTIVVPMMNPMIMAPGRAVSSSGAGGGAVIVLQSPDGRVVSLEDAADSVVINALERLSSDGRRISEEISTAGSAQKLRQYVEGNLLILQELRKWTDEKAIKRDDLIRLSSEIQKLAENLNRLVADHTVQSKDTAVTLERLRESADKLREQGIRVNVTSEVKQS